MQMHSAALATVLVHGQQASRTRPEASHHGPRLDIHQHRAVLVKSQAGPRQAGARGKWVIRVPAVWPQPAAGGIRNKAVPVEGSTGGAIAS